MKNVHIKLRFTDPILGMSPSEPEIYTKFIAAKKPTADFDVQDELDAIDQESDSVNNITVFPRDSSGTPCFFDYQIRGFFKDACKLLSHVKGVDEATGKRSKKQASTLSGKLTAYQKVIDGNIFVYPRKIPIHFEGGVALCQRPLRAMTAKGERVSLACSEQINEGAWIEFDVTLYNDLDLDVLAEWLTYGRDHGMGQWRNSGKGRFLVEEFVVSDKKSTLTPYFQIQRV